MKLSFLKGQSTEKHPEGKKNRHWVGNKRITTGFPKVNKILR